MKYLRIASSVLAFVLLTACGNEQQSPDLDNSQSPEADAAQAGSAIDESAAANVEGCFERFAAARDLWGDSDVNAAFTYELGPMDEEELAALIQSMREASGTNQLVINTGSNAQIAAEEFLASTQQKDTEYFQAGEIRLLRVRNAEPAPFDAALRQGCEGAPDGADVRQVTFSQGNE